MRKSALLQPAVIVSALGYFVDIYDLVLFSIVRVASLKELGDNGPALFKHGMLLINMQMAGMLIGGILWGILGDKKGRISVLFGSILLYSLANIANGFVTTVEAYAGLRFVAGIGLAGELGAGITLVSEILPKQTRGLGTTLIASVGVCGAILAAWIGEAFHWRTAYFIGGGLGLLLLFLRYGVIESGLFAHVLQKPIERGNFLKIFSHKNSLVKYLRCICIGMPTWFVVGILVTFSTEFGAAFGIAEPIVAGRAILYCYVGLAIGDFSSGLLSQLLKSRRQSLALFLTLTLLSILFYLLYPITTAQGIYFTCLALGFSVGFWAVFVTVGAEQFGTNLRATVATTVPNFVRGALVPISLVFTSLKSGIGIINSALVVGLLCVAIAFAALKGLAETFAKDLDFTEG